MYDVANDNLQGQLTILKSTLESLAISFGELMLPKVKALTTWLQKLAEKFNSLTTKQKENVLKWGTIIASIGPVLLIFGKLVLFVGNVVSVIGKFGTMLKSFGSLGAIIASPAGIVIAVIAGIAVAVALIIKNWDKLKPYFEKAKEWFIKIFNKIKEVVMTYVPPAIEKLKEAFNKALPVIKNIITSVIAKVAPVVKAIVAEVIRLLPIIKDKLTQAFQIALPVIKKFISTAVSVGKHLLSAIKSAWTAIKPVLKALGELIGVVFDKVVEKASDIYTKVKPFIKALIDGFLVIAEKVAPVISVAFDVIGAVVKNFIDVVKIRFEGFMGVLKGIITFVTGVFSGDWKKAWEGVVKIFGTVFNGIKEAFKIPINWIIDGINSFIKGLNKLKIPDWVPGVGGKSMNLPTIPKLEQGAVLEKGQTGFLEGNGAEAVVPLHQNKKWISAVARDMAQNGIGGSSDEMLEAFLAFVAALPDILVEAFGYMKLSVNNREFARLVKAVN
jgi:phage-related protein